MWMQHSVSPVFIEKTRRRSKKDTERKTWGGHRGGWCFAHPPNEKQANPKIQKFGWKEACKEEERCKDICTEVRSLYNDRLICLHLWRPLITCLYVTTSPVKNQQMKKDAKRKSRSGGGKLSVSESQVSPQWSKVVTMKVTVKATTHGLQQKL